MHRSIELVNDCSGHNHLARGGLTSPQLRRISIHLRENVQERLRVVDLAGVVNLSPSYFSRAFSHTVGMSPHFAVSCYRLLVAAEVIERTNCSLAEVACLSGFCDQAHLTRHFRRHLGISPAGWRKLPRRTTSLATSIGQVRTPDFRVTMLSKLVAHCRAMILTLGNVDRSEPRALPQTALYI